ncbi:hypothetical protein Taro_043171 [Colocasia esculenta]|uniref:Methyltransferase type 11 domain-containing protein n=1 Tax=Colocasia esculenta TaxID=4460 RepID=A0A843WIR1_COLES|nr:hypothetical protein [Colocasia esculenta]
MGNIRMDDYHPKRGANQQQQSRRRQLLKVLLLLLSTNLLTFYLFSGNGGIRWVDYAPRLPPLGWDTTTLLRELNATQAKLSDSQAQLVEIHRRLTTSNSLLEVLLTEMRRLQGPTEAAGSSWADDLPAEAKLVVEAQKLPLGENPKFGSDKIYPVLGSACARYQEELLQYMTYEVGGECPVDDVLAQRLMLKGCEPLPRRRCRPKSPLGYVEPSPLPASLWATPPDTSIIWEPYSCKNYHCLENRRHTPGVYDCKDCFELSFREKSRWLDDTPGGLDYGIDAVLAARPRGTIRIGLDIGGGVGTFATRMWERNVTIVTSSLNLDGPFNNFIASRGLVPLHITVSHRLPFFDGTLDIVHSMHILSNWMPDATLEFAVYDIYRVLRPGGLFWLDHFFCLGSQLNTTYIPMLERIGFGKLRWDAGRKLDRGADKDEWYLSALLEKPMA